MLLKIQHKKQKMLENAIKYDENKQTLDAARAHNKYRKLEQTVLNDPHKIICDDLQNQITDMNVIHNKLLGSGFSPRQLANFRKTVVMRRNAKLPSDGESDNMINQMIKTAPVIANIDSAKSSINNLLEKIASVTDTENYTNTVLNDIEKLTDIVEKDGYTLSSTDCVSLIEQLKNIETRLNTYTRTSKNKKHLSIIHTMLNELSNVKSMLENIDAFAFYPTADRKREQSEIISKGRKDAKASKERTKVVIDTRKSILDVESQRKQTEKERRQAVKNEFYDDIAKEKTRERQHREYVERPQRLKAEEEEIEKLVRDTPVKKARDPMVEKQEKGKVITKFMKKILTKKAEKKKLDREQVEGDLKKAEAHLKYLMGRESNLADFARTPQLLLSRNNQYTQHIFMEIENKIKDLTDDAKFDYIKRYCAQQLQQIRPEIQSLNDHIARVQDDAMRVLDIDEEDAKIPEDPDNLREVKDDEGVTTTKGIAVEEPELAAAAAEITPTKGIAVDESTPTKSTKKYFKPKGTPPTAEELTHFTDVMKRFNKNKSASKSFKFYVESNVGETRQKSTNTRLFKESALAIINYINSSDSVKDKYTLDDKSKWDDRSEQYVRLYNFVVKHNIR